MTFRHRLIVVCLGVAWLTTGLLALPLGAQDSGSEMGAGSGSVAETGTVAGSGSDSPADPDGSDGSDGSDGRFSLRVPWVEAAGFARVSPSGEVISFAAELARMIGAEAGFDIDFVEFSSAPEVIGAMRDGAADMLAGIGRLPGLQAGNIFSDKVAETRFILFVRRDAPNTWSIDTFQNRRIGVIRNTFASRMTPPDGAELVAFEDQITAFGKLLIGEVDGVVVVHSRGERTLRRAGLDGLIRATSPAAITSQHFVALNRDRSDLMPRIQAALDRLEASGALEDLRARWAMLPPTPIPEVLVVGVAHFPPYQVVTPDGQFSGISVEALRGIAQRANVDLQFREITRESWAVGPRPGAFDLVPARSINAAELQWLQFSLPILTIEYAPHVLVGSTLEIETPSDLSGMRVGLLFSSPVRARIEKEIGTPILPVENVADGVEALRAGDIDVLIFPARSISDHLAAEGLQSEITRLPAPVFRNALAIAMRAGLGDLKRQLDAVIPGYLGGSEYQRLSQTWLERQPYWTRDRLRLLFGGLGVILVLSLLAVLVLSWRARQTAERLRAEAMSANERLTAVIAGTRQAIFGFAEDGQIRVINPSGQALIGTAPGNTPARWPDTAEFLDPENRAPFAPGDDPLQKGMSGKTVSGLVCLFRQDRTQQPRFVRVTSEAIRDSRTALRALLIVEDEHENELNRQKLDRSHRLSSMGQLTGGLAHDFNNILATVLYNAELAKMMAKAPDQPVLDRIIDTVRTGSDLTKRLLAFARRAPQPDKVVKLAASLMEAEALARPVIGETIALEMPEVSETLYIRCDHSELETALLNLVLNARDAIEEAGKGDRITVMVRSYDMRDRPADGSSDIVPQQPVVEISVSDNGPGMTEEIRRRASDPFFSTKTETGGTGLGLAMVESFVTRVGGHMSIYSETGLGTTIRLRLPRVTAQNEPEAPGEPAELPQGHGERILLVEDQQDLREPMAQLLSELGYQVDTASSGKDALPIVRDQPGYDLVLSDIVMPGGVSGIDLARALRASHPDIALLLMTGFANIGAEDLQDLDVEVLRKPCPVHQMASAIRDALTTRPSAASHRPDPG